jgi:hypothetical protein
MMGLSVVKRSLLLYRSVELHASSILSTSIYIYQQIKKEELASYVRDAHLGEDQLTLEGFSLALASPDTQDEWHLDVWQGHEVLGEVHNELVHEGRGDVQAVQGVVHVVPAGD